MSFFQDLFTGGAYSRNKASLQLQLTAKMNITKKSTNSNMET